ncbi:hypothetical protein ACQPYE_17115 [Actinosynnema sp. CA-299493]
MTQPSDESNTTKTDKNGAVYPTGDGGSRADYDTMDWKSIQAVITGNAAVGKRHANGQPIDQAAVDARARGVSDPASLWQAATNLRWVQEALSMVALSLEQQVTALTGEDGAWRGPASEAFRTVMKPFIESFANAADQIAGGITGSRSAPAQLWDAGNYLEWARRTVWEINRHYAAEIVRIANAYDGAETQVDPRTGQPIIDPNGAQTSIRYRMSNGNIWINWNKQVVEMMSNDMRVVLKTLAGQYEHVDIKVKPDVVTMPQSGNGPNSNGPNTELPPYPKPPPFEFPPFPPPPAAGPPPSQPPPVSVPPPVPNPPSIDGPDLGGPEGFEPPPLENKQFETPPPPGVGAFDPGNPPGTGGLPGLDSPEIVGPDGLPLPNPDAFDPNAPGLNAFDPNAPGLNAFDPNAPGLDAFDPNAPGGPSGGLPGVVPPMINPVTGGPMPGVGNVPQPTPFKPGAPAGGGATPPGLGGANPPALDEFDPLAPPGLGTPDDWETGVPPALSAPNPSGAGVPPMMPPMSPMSPPQPASTDRSDASGLIGGEAAPWEGAGVPGVGDPVGLAEVPPVTPEDWAAPQPGAVGTGLGAGAGVPPMMPPMSPMSPPQAASTDRSDASGLIGGEAAPWEGADLPDVGDPVGLAEVPPVASEEWAAPQQQVPAGGVPPMMPPVSPMSPPQPASTDRSDASGLIGGEAAPWEGAGVPGVGDPAGSAEVPPVASEEWAALQQQVPAGGVPPMMPPVSPMSPPQPASTDRSDASGLILGETTPWAGVDLPSGEDPQDQAVMPPVAPQEWAATPPDPVTTPSADPVTTPVAEPTAPVGAGPSLPPEVSGPPGTVAPQAVPPPVAVAAPAPPSAASPVVVPPVVPLPVPPTAAQPPAAQPSAPPTGAQPPAAQPPAQPGPPSGRAGGEGAGTGARKEEALLPGGVLLTGQEPPSATVATGLVPEEPEDVVPVVTVDGDEDTSAWGTAGAGGLLWLSSKSAEQDGEADAEFTPDYALRDSAPWQHSSTTAVRPVPQHVVRSDGGHSIPRPYFPTDDVPMAGEQEPPEEPDVVEDEGEEDGEEPERAAIDLLKQDERAWGTPASRAPGVIE